MYKTSQHLVLGESFNVIYSGSTIVCSGFEDPESLAKRYGDNPINEAIKNQALDKALTKYESTGELTISNSILCDYKTEFTTAVVNAMKNIQSGSPVSYASLAKKAGKPGAARAAASVCANNSMCLLIPCHRVIKSDGAIGEYYYGTSLKLKLLDHEA